MNNEGFQVSSMAKIFTLILVLSVVAFPQAQRVPLLILRDANTPSLSFFGERIAVSPEVGLTDVYQVDSGKKLRGFQLANSIAESISGDGKFLRMFGDNQSAIFEVDSGKLLSLEDTSVYKDRRNVGSVGLRTYAGSLQKNYSPDLDFMAVVYPWWDDKNASPDQPAIIIGKLSDHSLIRSLKAPDGFVKHDIWSSPGMTPDTKSVVSERNNIGQPERNITIVWNLETGKPILSLPFSSRWFSISDDGSRLITNARGDAGRIKVWDVPSGKLLSTVDQYVGGEKILVSWGMLSPDGSLLVTARNVDFYLWDTTTGKLITSQKQDDISKGNVKSIAFSGDGKRIAIGSDTEVVTVWSVASILSRSNKGSRNGDQPKPAKQAKFQ
jgi:WD40 repeat protein